METPEQAVARIVAKRTGRPRKGARAAEATPPEPPVPHGRDSRGRFVKGSRIGVEKGTPFVPGVCPNPGGRPKLSDALAEVGATRDPLTGLPYTEAAARAMWRKACGGDVPAFKEIADRTEGKQSQPITVTVQDMADAQLDAELAELEAEHRAYLASLDAGARPRARRAPRGKAKAG